MIDGTGIFTGETRGRKKQMTKESASEEFDSLYLDGTGGFSLLEILVAMMILAVALSAVFALFGEGAAAQARATHITDASRLAASLHNEVQQRLSLEDLENLSDQTDPREPEGYPPHFSYVYRFIDLPGTQQAVGLEIRVRWQSEGEQRERSFFSVLRPVE